MKEIEFMIARLLEENKTISEENGILKSEIAELKEKTEQMYSIVDALDKIVYQPRVNENAV